jgi:hypothetical protein
MKCEVKARRNVIILSVMMICLYILGMTGGDSGSYLDTRMYPKVSVLTAWSKNCNWYSSLPLAAVVSLLCESV